MEKFYISQDPIGLHFASDPRDDRPRGQWGYIAPNRTSTGARTDIRSPMEGPPVNRTQRVLNLVDNGSISTGVGGL
jgi:hypothetical protein